MHIKHIHETIEKLSQYACEEACKSKESINTEELGEVIDMVKDLACAEKDARISKAMEEADKEEEEEIKYIMKKMKEEGEEWGEEEARRFYRGQPRSKTSGRFMSRGDGRRSRGYEEPVNYPVMPDIYNPMEYYRDVDRAQGRMYYSGDGTSAGNQGGQSNAGSHSGGMSGNMGGSSNNSVRGYSDGYSDGYREGERNNRQSESRSERARRSYTETKEMNKGNSPEEKQRKMKELEAYTKELAEDVTAMIADASQEERSLLKQKMQVLMQKI